MNEELVRVVVGLPVAVLAPLGIPRVAASAPRRATVAAIVAALVVARVLPDWEGWLLLVGAAAVAAALRGQPAREDETRAEPWPFTAAVLAAAALAAAAALLLDAGGAVEAVRDAVRSDEIVFVFLGAMTAVFVTGALLAAALEPLAERVRTAGLGAEAVGLVRAGLYIGWLERALVFTLLVGGEPGAAGLALTAKSVARFPVFAEGKEPLAEYVLIGTLASFLAVTLSAVGTRALIGLPVL